MRSRFTNTVFVVSMVVFPALAAQPDANRVTYQLASSDSGTQLRVYGIESRRRDRVQHRLCYADFDVQVPGEAALPQLAQALNGSPQVFSTLVSNGRVSFPAPALDEARLRDGKLQLIPSAPEATPVTVEACSRTDLRNFGPQLHSAPPNPGWDCRAGELRVSLRQAALAHLRATAQLNEKLLAEWDDVIVTEHGAGYAFSAHSADADFELVGVPSADGFEARLDLHAPQGNYAQNVRCQLSQE